MPPAKMCEYSDMHQYDDMHEGVISGCVMGYM